MKRKYPVRCLRGGHLAPLLVALGLNASAITANAADSIYWANRVTNTVRFGELADVSGTVANLVGDNNDDDPCGVVVHPAEDKIYWANFDSTNGATDNTIRVADLDGSNPQTLVGPTGVSQPCGIAINPAANKIYWADLGTDSIRVADLDDGGNLQELVGSAGNDDPVGVVIDPAGNKIYWTNEGAGSTIRFADLDDGGNVGTLIGPPNATNPLGLAIDPAANKLYWTDLGTDTVKVANLDDGSNVQTLVGSAGDGPGGVAFDSGANKIYWAAFFGGSLASANLNDGSNVQTLISAEGSNGPNFPVLLRAPVGIAVPVISGGGEVGQQLSCSQGTWESDLLGAFLFRAPRSFAFQWQLDGDDIDGATQNTYTPIEPGDYTCRVTADNEAGSTAQTSNATTVTPAPTATPTVTDTPTETPTPTETDTPTETPTPSATDEDTFTPTHTETQTPTETQTATVTQTPTVTRTASMTGTATATSTPGSLCPPSPQGGCRAAAKSLLKLSNKSDNAKDKLLWKWIKGPSTMQSDFGDPTTTASTALCVYDNGASVLSAIIPPGNLWSASSSGYKYKDADAATAGMKKVILKGSTSAKSKIVMSGKGANLPDPVTVMLTGPVTAQLVNSDTTVCFTATYAAEQIDSSAESFKAKSP